MWLHADHVHVFYLLVVKSLAIDHITGVDTTAIVFFGRIVKENVLREVVSLIDEEWLTSLTIELRLLPGVEVLLNQHG